ncbi:type 1 glutamine amidotransferase domain-containing protein [Acidisoma sp. C75]
MSISHQKIAALVTDGFEEVELTGPVEVLRAAGATVTVVSPKSGELQGMNHDKKAGRIRADVPLSGTTPDAYDALLLPGGVANPDYLRVDEAAVAFVQHFVTAQKPIAAICHGPWTLIEADGVKGKRMTSWPSLKTDLRNAGAEWVDEEAVTDGLLVTARKPDDIPAFSRAFVDLLEQAGEAGGREGGQRAGQRRAS